MSTGKILLAIEDATSRSMFINSFFAIVGPLILLIATVDSAASYCEYQHCFRVNNGNDTGPGSLHEALESAHHYDSSVEILLENGTFPLLNSFSLVNGSMFSFKGHGPDLTIINCTTRNTGLFFDASDNLSFTNISILGCGQEFISTSFNSSDHSFLKSRSAVFFNSCHNLTLEDLKIENADGFGITMYNTAGNNRFFNCKLIDNFLKGGRYLGGGGLVLETSYCSPGDLSCGDNSTVQETTRAVYMIEKCDFLNNRAYIGDSHSIVSYPRGKFHMVLGTGGGLSVVFKGHAISNEVIVKSCNFSGNRARWGGALYLTFADTSFNNSISFADCSLSNNNASEGAGGAVRAEFVSAPSCWSGYTSNVTNNSVSFNDTCFESNFGSWGGGVSLSSTRTLYEMKELNHLKFNRCSFERNKANKVGSAVDLSSWMPDHIEKQKYYMTPVFSNCYFAFNKFEYEGVHDHPLGFGAFYVNQLPTEFVGNTTFYRNSETALVVTGSFIYLSRLSNMMLLENQGRRGGAIAFIGDSWMNVGENVSVYFYSNTVGVHGLGGAVYSTHFNDHDLSPREDCFFRYKDITVKPSKWKAKFLFRNNTADRSPNSIYTTSILPCKLYGNIQKKEDNTFCYNSIWIFEDEDRNCSTDITTGPSRLDMPSTISVYPGWKTNVAVKTYDDFNQSISTVLIASSSSEDIAVSNSTRYTSDGSIVVYGIENTTDNKILIMTPDPRVITQTLTIQILSCPVGFQGSKCQGDDLSTQRKTCDCVCANISGIECNNTKDAYLEKFTCATESHKRKDVLAIAKCPYNKLKLLLKKEYTVSNLSTLTCDEANRNGTLCSDCKDGYGVGFNSLGYECVECNNSRLHGWLLYFFSQFLLSTMACFLIVLFKVNVASPSMNAFLFFSQVILYDYYHTDNRFYGSAYFSPYLSKTILFLYGICNLEFLLGLEVHCLDKQFNTLQVVLIKYFNAFYPMLVLLICYICIKIYYRNYRILHLVWLPFQKCLKSVRPKAKSSSSVTDAFTTLLVLSYSKVLHLSYPLIAPVTVYHSNANTTVTVSELRYYFQPSVAINSARFFYFMFGLVGLTFFVCIPPVFLILYTFSFVQAGIGKINTRLQIVIRTFADSFFGGYKDGTSGSLDCRWISATYLLFRIIVFVANIPIIDAITRHLIQALLYNFAIALFAIIRPYKSNVYNYLDICIFTILNILVFLSLCNSWYGSKNHQPNVAIYYSGFVLTLLPMLYLFCLVSFKVLEKIKHKVPVSKIRFKKQTADIHSPQFSERTYNSEMELPFEDSEDLPHRFLHPEVYKPLGPLSAADPSVKKSTSSLVKKKATSQRRKSEKSYFLGNTRPAGNYGGVSINNGTSAWSHTHH